jgi:glyceraldehyde 3-phosphate dehydrogenase
MTIRVGINGFRRLGRTFVRKALERDDIEVVAVTAEEVNAAFERAAAGPMDGILDDSTYPLVSRDIIGNPASCVFDSGLTQAAGSLVKVFGWYDIEWGYTCRLVDLTAIVGGGL